MKRILSTLLPLLALSLLPLKGQSFDALKKALLYNEVTFDYSYIVNKDISLRGSGTLTLNSPRGAYHMVGDGLDVWCDGTTRWTMDPAAKEMVIEKEYLDDYSSSPARILFNLGEDFSVKNTSGNTVELSPKRNMGITKAYLKFGGSGQWSLTNVQVYFSDGSVADFAVSNFRNVKVIDRSSLLLSNPYTFNEKKLDSSWVITDLR